MSRKVGIDKVVVNIEASRCMSNAQDDFVELRLECNTSHIHFAVVRLSMSEFGNLVTGAGVRRKEIEVCGLEHVGKKYIHSNREIFCPIKGYDKEPLRQWLRDNAKEDGWYLDTYLGSQGSTRSVDGGQILKYSVYRYE